jgi:hypothetical protein
MFGGKVWSYFVLPIFKIKFYNYLLSLIFKEILKSSRLGLCFRGKVHGLVLCNFSSLVLGDIF